MTITSEFVVFVLMILGAVFTAWWRIESVIKREVASAIEVAKAAASSAAAASAHAHLIAAQLAEHKLHIAENYSTKAGVREMRDEIMTGVRDLKASMSNIHNRIDQIVLGPSERVKT